MERTWAASAQGQGKDKEVKWEIAVSGGCGESGFYHVMEQQDTT